MTRASVQVATVRPAESTAGPPGGYRNSLSSAGSRRNGTRTRDLKDSRRHSPTPYCQSTPATRPCQCATTRQGSSHPAVADPLRHRHHRHRDRGPELRHRQRARAEDRTRAARDTGLRNLPLHHTAQNQVWLEIVQLALDRLAWMPMFALTGRARRLEPKRLWLRLFSAAARLVTTGRRRILRLARHWPDRRDHYRVQQTAGPTEPRLSTNDDPSRRAAEHLRNRGIRRTPDATVGPSAYPPLPTQAETARRPRRRTVMKNRG